MEALARVLQAVGWLWFAAGLGSSIFDLGAFSPLPGIILIFVARVLRSQSGRRGSEQPQGQAPEEEPVSERELNTERQRTAMPTSPSPVVPTPPSPRPRVAEQAVSTPRERDDLLGKIAAAGEDVVEEKSSAIPILGGPVEEEAGSFKPMSSDEMIARARRRWDSKPRRG